MKKKLLYLSQCFPIPLDGGGKIKTYNTLKTLSSAFDIYSIFVSERKPTKEGLNIFKKMNVKTKVFQTDIMSENIKKNYFKLLWNYIQFRPHFVYQYRYKPAFKYIKNKIINWKPDIIHVDHINSSQFLPSNKWFRKKLDYVPVLILENHNLNHLIFKTRFNETKKIIRKLYLFIEGYLNEIYGLINYRKYNHIFCISNQEKMYLKKFCQSVFTQPLVYPLKKSKTNTNIGKYDILFIGFLNWPPNEEAVKWFISKILPIIKLRIPNVKLHVVGKNNSNLDIYKNFKNVVFHGHKNNIDEFLSSSKVFILPFKTGAGVRIKCMSALQNGIPFVSTKLGVVGYKLRDKKEYLLSNNELSFAKNVVKLLKSKKLRQIISKNQIRYFKKHHSTLKNKLFLEKYIKICQINSKQ